MKSILLSLHLLTSAVAEDSSDFDFYLEELVSHELDAEAPMSQLIVQNLAESIFDTESEKVFQARLQRLRTAFSDHPRRAERFVTLHRALEKVYAAKIKEAKRLRMIYSGAGAVVGALIGIPVVKSLGGSTKLLLITVPLGAAAGGGAGFLLGNLLAMPDYEFDSTVLDFQLRDIDEAD